MESGKEQEIALRQLFQVKNNFFSAHTGYGKSLIFYAILVMADVMAGKVTGISLVVVNSVAVDGVNAGPSSMR